MNEPDLRYDPSFIHKDTADVCEMERLHREAVGVPAHAPPGDVPTVAKADERRRRLVFVAVTLTLPLILAGAVVGFSRRSSRDRSESGAALVIPTPDINVVCSARMLSESITSYVRCKNMCQPGLCCLSDPSDEFNCQGLHEDACRVYEVCKNLDVIGDGSDESTALRGHGGLSLSDTVEAACSEEGVVPPGKSSPCEVICSAAACCFTDGELNCGVDCSIYEPCEFLYKGSFDVTTKSVMDVLCAEDVVTKPDGLNSCEEACELGDCCFSSTGCHEAGVDVNCLDFVACATLYELDDDDEFEDIDMHGDESSDESLGSAVMPLVEVIDEACSQKALETSYGMENCESICEESSCCWMGGNASCFSTGRDITCHEYLSCTVLYGEKAVISGKDDEKTSQILPDAEGVFQGWAPSVCAPDLVSAMLRCQDPGLSPCDDPIAPTNEPCHMRCDDVFGFGEDSCSKDGEKCIKFVEGCTCPIPPCNGLDYNQAIEVTSGGNSPAGNVESPPVSGSEGELTEATDFSTHKKRVELHVGAVNTTEADAGDSGGIDGWAPSVCAPDLTTAAYRCQNPKLPACDDPVNPTNQPCHMRCDTIYGFGEDACKLAGERCIQFVEGCICPTPPCDEANNADSR